jgi:FHA domain-containing protein
MVLSAAPSLPLDQFLLLLRLALVALLYIVILQVVGVARRDLRRLAVAPAAAAARGVAVVGHLVVIDSGSSPLLPGAKLDLLGQTTIGRAPTNGIVVDSKFVSAEHARVVYRDRSLWVENLGGRNGTSVNQQLVTDPVAVRPGDLLQIGDVRFKFAV